MKGIIFTEFLEMVDLVFGAEVSDQIITEADLPSGGAYTSVGTYDFSEMVSLVSLLAEKTGFGVPELLRRYGEYLFARFAEHYPHFFENVDGALDFLRGVDSYIHVEVRKLYPDAQLPSFAFEEKSPDEVRLVYRSRRALSDVAEGLIKGCCVYFKEDFLLEKKDLSNGEGTVVEFLMKRVESE